MYCQSTAEKAEDSDPRRLDLRGRHAHRRADPRGLRTYIPETTKIIIAQRVASVQDADLILVMDNGHIADMGTHDQLLASSEIYREVYESQTNGGEQDEA